MSILLEAHKLVHGDRQKAYGAPDECLRKTAEMWSIYKGVKFSTDDVGMFNMLQKQVRYSFKPKRDSLVDIAGYAECIGLADTDSVENIAHNLDWRDTTTKGPTDPNEYPEFPHQGSEHD